MANGYATRDDVRAMGDDVITRVSQLMAQERGYREQQHAENKGLFQSVIAKQDITNGRVTRLEEAVKFLREEFQTIRQRWHSFRDSVQDAISKTVTATGELSPVTRLDIKTAFGIYVFGIGTLMAIMKLLGKV
jgi:hypothetical protein